MYSNVLIVVVTNNRTEHANKQATGHISPSWISKQAVVAPRTWRDQIVAVASDPVAESKSTSLTVRKDRGTLTNAPWNRKVVKNHTLLLNMPFQRRVGGLGDKDALATSSA